MFELKEALFCVFDGQSGGYVCNDPAIIMGKDQ
jgi:hypothetical protein